MNASSSSSSQASRTSQPLRMPSLRARWLGPGVACNSTKSASILRAVEASTRSVAGRTAVALPGSMPSRLAM